jgi:uncharacterized Zn-binding protein involved in type VI secretion
MPGIARKGGTDSVASPDGSGPGCGLSSTQATAEGSSDVFVNGIGVVRKDDAMNTHNGPGCIPHAPTLSTYSGSVFVNGRNVGRLGDSYNGHRISSASTNVFAGN